MRTIRTVFGCGLRRYLSRTLRPSDRGEKKVFAGLAIISLNNFAGLVIS